jgi:hypothetical protein
MSQEYIKTQERIKSRAIAAIFRKEMALFAAYLEAAEEKAIVRKRFSLETKVTPEQFVDPFLDEIAPDVPEYLVTSLPAVMTQGAKPSIARYRKLLPNGYSLSFDIETSPASRYLRNLEDLHLSQRDGSILKTTRERLIGIMEEGVAAGESYGKIAKKIRAESPWVFSAARAALIAVNEVGRAYGWANHEPAIELQRQGYVLEKIWATKEDEKVRRTHTANQAAGWIPLSASFPGTLDQFAPSTNEIRCRCTSTHRIVGIDDGKSVHPVRKGASAEEIAKKHFDLRNPRV